MLFGPQDVDIDPPDIPTKAGQGAQRPGIVSPTPLHAHTDVSMETEVLATALPDVPLVDTALA